MGAAGALAPAALLSASVAARFAAAFALLGATTLSEFVALSLAAAHALTAFTTLALHPLVESVSDLLAKGLPRLLCGDVAVVIGIGGVYLSGESIDFRLGHLTVIVGVDQPEEAPCKLGGLPDALPTRTRLSLTFAAALAHAFRNRAARLNRVCAAALCIKPRATSLAGAPAGPPPTTRSFLCYGDSGNRQSQHEHSHYSHRVSHLSSSLLSSHSCRF